MGNDVTCSKHPWLCISTRLWESGGFLVLVDSYLLYVVNLRTARFSANGIHLNGDPGRQAGQHDHTPHGSFRLKLPIKRLLARERATLFTLSLSLWLPTVVQCSGLLCLVRLSMEAASSALNFSPHFRTMVPRPLLPFA